MAPGGGGGGGTNGAGGPTLSRQPLSQTTAPKARHAAASRRRKVANFIVYRLCCRFGRTPGGWGNGLGSGRRSRTAGSASRAGALRRREAALAAPGLPEPELSPSPPV